MLRDVIGAAITVAFFAGTVIGLIIGAGFTYTALSEKRHTH